MVLTMEVLVGSGNRCDRRWHERSHSDRVVALSCGLGLVVVGSAVVFLELRACACVCV